MSVTLAERSPELGGFYVPAFEVRIEGAGLPSDVLRDVISVTYRDSIEEIDSFDLTVNNWDDRLNQFKYIGSEPRDRSSLGAAERARFELFDPCNKTVDLWLGYAGQLVRMLSGTFTTLEPSFPSSGAPTLTVRGLNALHRLRRRQYTTAWTAKKDSWIARNIATLRDRRERRFPIPIRIDESAMRDEEELEYVVQDNQYDIDFLLTRARRRGYVVYLEEADAERGTPQRLYFGPSENREEPITYELAWGESLVDFKPSLTTANQVRSVTVRGWDRRRQREISETVSLDDRRIRINRDLHEVLMDCDPREEQVVHEPVFSRAEARRRATNLLLDRNREMVTASASTVGLPRLRAGRRVQIVGVGGRFSGTYFIKSSEHRFDPSGGYTTRFEARREDQEEGRAG